MNVSERIDREAARIGEVATAGYFLALRIRGAAPMLALRTYPEAWTQTYLANGYMLRDPITTWAMTVGGTIRWSSPFLPDPFGVFRQAAAHGLKFGASVAHGPIRSLSICSFSRSDREFTDAEIALVRAIVIDLHDLTALPKSLTPDDKALLNALATEEDPRKVAEQLGLTAAITRDRINHLRVLLFAGSAAEAVQRARDHKLI